MTKNILPPADTRSHQVETMVASSNSGGTWTIGNILVSIPEKYKDDKNFKKRMVLYNTYLKVQDPVVWDMYLNQRYKLKQVCLEWLISKYDISGLENELKEEFVQASKIYLNNFQAEVKELDNEARKRKNEKCREYQRKKKEAIKAGTYVKKSEAKAIVAAETQKAEEENKIKNVSLEEFHKMINERKNKREHEERKAISMLINKESGSRCKY